MSSSFGDVVLHDPRTDTAGRIGDVDARQRETRWFTYASGSTTLGTLTYAYDAAGHVASRGGTLFQSILPAAVTSATYDAANRLTARTAAGATAKPTWDANGNLTNDGASAYTWDARDKLLTIGSKARFVNDGLGRRVSATRSGTATSFLYGGWDVLQEQQGGKSSADLIVGLSADERFARAGSTFLVDALGSTVALATSGAVKTNYGYDPYGVSTTTGTASTSTFGFTGRENDGTGLLNYRNRYYNPAWGRFVSEDPIGLAGGVNVYAYANGDPADLRDPYGLYSYAGDPSNPSAPTKPTKDSGQQQAANRPIKRCTGTDGRKCDAPMEPGGINPDYPTLCSQCLLKKGLWPWGGPPPIN